MGSYRRSHRSNSTARRKAVPWSTPAAELRRREPRRRRRRRRRGAPPQQPSL